MRAILKTNIDKSVAWKSFYENSVIVIVGVFFTIEDDVARMTKASKSLVLFFGRGGGVPLGKSQARDHCIAVLC